MTEPFFRYPHTPHLGWLGSDSPRDDKVLPAHEVRALLGSDVVVEEKLDGTNVGFSHDSAGGIRAQVRGQYLQRPFGGQFSRLEGWLAQHGALIAATLPEKHIAFGEWCAARHSLAYDRLPDWWLPFDLYDRDAGSFWSTDRRDAWASVVGLPTVPALLRGRTALPELERLLNDSVSRFGPGPLEGVIVRRDVGGSCVARAKLIRADFVQSIEAHWSARHIEWNRLAPAV